MTVRAAVKRQRRLAIEAAYVPELRQPWLVESLGIVLGTLYILWLKLWSR